MRVYLSGPMTGLPDFNYPAFNVAAAELRRRGFDVVNPAELAHAPGAAWEDFLRRDLAELLTCEAVFVLPGWEASRGALLELTVARALEMLLVDVAVLDGDLVAGRQSVGPVGITDVADPVRPAALTDAGHPVPADVARVDEVADVVANVVGRDVQQLGEPRLDHLCPLVGDHSGSEAHKADDAAAFEILVALRGAHGRLDVSMQVEEDLAVVLAPADARALGRSLIAASDQVYADDEGLG